MKIKPHFLKYIGLLFTASLVLAYCFVGFNYTVNIPFGDDFDQVHRFLMNRDKGYWGFSNYFLAHNEHRILINRMLTISSYKVFGGIDLRYVIYSGYVTLFFLWLLMLSEINIKNKLFYFLPATFLAFIPIAGLINWAGTSYMYPGVLLFSFLALFELRKEGRKHFVFAIIAGLCAMFSLANGLFVFPCGLLMLGIQQRWKTFLLWLIVSAAAFAYYFYDFHPPTHPITPMDALMGNKLLTLDYFFSFLGSFSKNIFSMNLWLGRLVGLIVFGSFCLLVVKNKFQFVREQPHIFAALVFILISIALAALHRSGYGIVQAYSNRYQLFPTFFVILLYVQFIKNKMPSIKIIIPALSIAILMYGGGFISNDRVLKKHKMSLVSGIEHYSKTGQTDKLSYPNFDASQEVLDYTISQGIYVIPED